MYLLEFVGHDDALAVAEAEAVAATVEHVGPGLGLARGLSLDRVPSLALTHRALELVGRTDANLESATTLLEAAPIDRSGTVAVRARDVHGSSGVSTAAVERELGAVLVDRGFSVDLDHPDHVLRAVFAVGSLEGESTDICGLGWVAAESVRDYSRRAPTDKPFFTPGSMDPQLARALVNIAGAGPDRTILDPMCGTAGLLVEAGLVGTAVVGGDAQRSMVEGARENLAHYLQGGESDLERPPGQWELIQADATRLPLASGAVDAVVFDAPYGRQSKIAGHDRGALVSGALEEARRLADRAVIVGNDPGERTARTAGWTIEASFERRVHRSLTRHILVLDATT